MTKMSRRHAQRTLSASAAGLLLLLAAQAAECQFTIQPQSHLGRLVQSIASPLVLASAQASGEADEPSAPATSYPGGPSEFEGAAGAAQHFQPTAAVASRQPLRNPFEAAQALQQAPSQERAIPQSFYAGRPSAPGFGQADQDEEAGAPSSPNRQRAQEYQMGAYLGPTIDDKEIQGAFSSKDDERDDDEGAVGFMGGAPQQRGRAASSPTMSQDYEGAGYGPMEGGAGAGSPSGYPMGHTGHAGPAPTAAFDDESGADEDEEQARPPRRPMRFRTSASLNQAAAASQYHQERRRQQARPSGGYAESAGQEQGAGGQQMQAAANGYAPYGYANGPIDLTSLMAAAAGAPSGPGGYEVYNGDGSYPGPGYYQQQGNNNQGRRNQAASGPGGYAGAYGPPGQQPGAQYQPGGRGDPDDQDSDADEDRKAAAAAAAAK